MASSQEPTYWEDVRPVLRKHCISCHNTRYVKEPEVSGGLALDSYQAVMTAPKKAVVHRGKSGDSPLYQRVTTKDEDLRMPPGIKPVPDDAVLLLRRWIDSGAAEGQKPADTTVTTTAPPRRRKLEVTLPTAATPPAGTFGTARPDKLQLSLRVGPLSPATAVVFSPDGKLLATGTYGRVTIWDVENVRPARVLTNVLGAVNDLRFSPDGKTLTVAGGQPSAKGDLRLFSVGEWKLLHSMVGHEDVVASVAFSPDGKKLVSASFDRTVRIWDLATVKTEQVLTGHSDFVYSVAFSPDGKKLASASKDRTAKLIDVATGQSRFTFSGMTSDVMAVAFSPDGKHVLSSGQEPGLYWWNVETGERDRLQRGHGVAVHEIAVAPPAVKLLASAGGDGTLRLWDAATGSQQQSLTAGSMVYAAALSPDGRLAAAGSFDGLVRVWDVKSARQLLTLMSASGESEGGEWLALTPEGYAAASPGYVQSAQWRMGTQPVAAPEVWKVLSQPALLSRAARGEALPAPFAK